MSDLSSFATGLSNAISGYMQQNQQTAREQQSNVQTYQQEKQVDQSMEGVVSPEMAEQMIPGASKWVSQFQQTNGRLPSINEVQTGLNSVVEKLSAINAKSTGNTNKTAQQSQNQLFQFQKQYDGDKVIGQEKTALAAANTAEDQVHLAVSNPVAYSSVPVTLARMMTGTSRINQMEIQRLGGSQAILDKANQVATQLGSGTITQDNASWMEDLVNTIKNSHQTNIENRTAEIASQYRQLSGDDLPTAYKKLTGGDIPPRFLNKPSQNVPVTAQQTDMQTKRNALRLKLGL